MMVLALFRTGETVRAMIDQRAVLALAERLEMVDPFALIMRERIGTS